jgi:predicted ribosomally synthesized peptide with nif11-like leader
MSAEAANAALDRMEADESFAISVRDAGGQEGSLALLRDAGFEVTPSEMRDAALDRYGDQLTPEQLDAIAAGQADDGLEFIVTMGVLTLAAAAASV